MTHYLQASFPMLIHVKLDDRQADIIKRKATVRFALNLSQQVLPRPNPPQLQIPTLARSKY